MFSFQILQGPDTFELDMTHIEQIATLVHHQVDIPQRGILNIAFLSDEEVQSLNREHRGIDKTTDVLSFHYFDDFSSLSDDETAGECIFSEDRILSQAREYGHLPREEFEILLIHSILHILGYDHEADEDFQVMWSREQPLRETLGLSTNR